MYIAILDDEPRQLELVKQALRIELSNYNDLSIDSFTSSVDLMASVRRNTYDLLILDWNVPDKDGDEVLFWLRNFQTLDTPVIILTGRENERDIAKALGIGADDYITKPFRQIEFGARVRNVLSHRRMKAEGTTDKIVSFGSVCFDVNNRIAIVKNEKIKLTETEVRLGLCLFRNLGNNISRSYLSEYIWGKENMFSSRTLDTHIYRLRNKLSLTSEHGWQLLTIYGFGYRLCCIDE